MTPQEAIEHGKEQLEVFGGEHKEFIKESIKALELKANLIKEIPTLNEVIKANYEMFMKYNIHNSTEIEDIAFSNFNNTVQNLQWLIGELECDTE